MCYIFNIADSIAAVFAIDYIHKVSPLYKMTYIILMHNGAKFTAEALDTVLTSLEEQGYEIVPVSQLIIRENFHMDGTGRQIGD